MHFWELSAGDTPAHVKNTTLNAPFKFYTDAILGLCYHKMTAYRHLTSEQKVFAEKSYTYFDHYTELFQKSAPRVKSLKTKNLTHQKHTEQFEKNMTTAWEKAFYTNTLSITQLSAALNCIADFEIQIGSPLIYNFSINFSAEFNQKLICFYSLLFHLRSVVAIDHNAHVDDSSYESVKCDSISDYLPKSDYTVNDAMLYWHFKKLTSRYTAANSKEHQPQIEKHLVTPMEKYFNQFNHNACNLIDQLPASFLSTLNENDLEDALHHVQMDWLLGSSSGLLFKIREEMYGVFEGYDKIFWTESSNQQNKKASMLNLCFELTAKDVSGSKAA